MVLRLLTRRGRSTCIFQKGPISMCPWTGKGLGAVTEWRVGENREVGSLGESRGGGAGEGALVAAQLW